ncbi:Regulatory LuxR family protein [Paraburkholderia unamae]|uniref:helix-turn-helix transcriptional regulator n=1 Tax=Paraburkholderia unamae TaxID=219649 RepID=UPI001CAC2CC0|nr:LuxR C-terminal-related transcriptional regulator [Paraburkholderia unamae]CAG9268616.1 Regulatory LuxR family protein [Paraburkholderia unamae]
MHEFSALLVLLHRAARELPFESFQEHALTLLKRVVPFDAARWGTTRHDERGAKYHAPFLYNDSPESLRDYEAVREHDPVAAWCLTHLDKVSNFELHEVCARNHDPGMLDYVRRYRHMQGLIVASRTGENGLLQVISLYGAYPDKRFDETQRRRLELVFPHLREALNTSLTFQMERIRPHAGGVAWHLAISDAVGDFHFVEPGFRDLLRHEWPTLMHRALPAALVGLINSRVPSRFQGRAVIALIDVLHDMVFVRARARMPVDYLSPRELEVAKLVVSGLTHKDIAKTLTLSPATVRNHLQAIHDRVGVHNNVELTDEFRRAGF